MEWWHVYLVVVADRVVQVGAAVAVAGGILSIVGVIVWAIAVTPPKCHGDDEAKTIAKCVLKFALPIFFVGLLIVTFIPNTKEIAAIYLIPKIVNNEEVKAVPDNALKLLNLKMEEWIEETVGEGEK